MTDLEKKVIHATTEWLKPLWDKTINDGGRCTYSEWKSGCHWVLSTSRFSIPKLVSLVMYTNSIMIGISSTKTFNNELCHHSERDMNTVVAITKGTVTFDENCESDHFSKEEIKDLCDRIVNCLGGNNDE